MAAELTYVIEIQSRASGDFFSMVRLEDLSNGLCWRVGIITRVYREDLHDNVLSTRDSGDTICKGASSV